MAAPIESPQQLAQIIHDNSPGFKLGPFTLASKTAVWTVGLRTLWQIVVTRGGNSWTIVYTTTHDGTLGKIYSVYDQDGRQWAPDWLGGTWADAGVG